jgi:hypothetical protein
MASLAEIRAKLAQQESRSSGSNSGGGRDNAINIGPTDDGRYQITLTGDVINGETVYINPTA